MNIFENYKILRSIPTVTKCCEGKSSLPWYFTRLKSRERERQCHQNIDSVYFEDTPHHMSMAPMSRYVFSRSHLSELCMDLASISEVENNYMGIPYSFFFNTLFLPLIPVSSQIFSHIHGSCFYQVNCYTDVLLMLVT